MKTYILSFLIAICIIAISFTIQKNHEVGSTINFDNLMNEITDRKAQTWFPEPAYSTYQASSWNRIKRNQETWFANQDYDHYIRTEKNGERTEYVIMEAKGPGAITRWWFPNKESLAKITVRIYMDNNPIPVIEENYANFINGTSFVKEPFGFSASDNKNAKFQVGANCYLPIPFAESCKVTLDDKPFYYGINYRIYKNGTKVMPFSKEIFNKYKSKVQKAGAVIVTENVSSSFTAQKSAVIAKDQQIEIDLPAGTKAINAIHLKINSRNNKQMNRAAVLQIAFDGRQTVWSPVSEFFGGGVYAGKASNRNMEVTESGQMISKWLMPYKQSAKLILKNYGTEPITAELKISVEKYNWTPSSMYFHADWHEDAPLDAPPAIDWNYISINGKGKYVGDVLTVYSIEKNWWGEGDEKIYVDGETFPSHIGTGMEDYYGYAWGIPNYFSSPFISMPLRDTKGKDWRGYHTMARIRILDDIPFNTSLNVNIEALNPKPGVTFSVCCFWYGMPGVSDNVEADTETVTRKMPDFNLSVNK